MRNKIALQFGVLFATIVATAHAGDWPMWRYDAGRTASSDAPLPQKLHLQWVRKLPPLTPAWIDQPELQFDHQYEPIVADGRMFIGSSNTDSLAAYDARSGEPLWEFRAAGPIRLAPVAHNGKVLVASDDGHLYCVAASDGGLLWKHRGGPTERKVLGNERLISMWPVRGGPVVADGTVYYAAGIFPFMGIFLHALDADAGEVRWTNDGDGSRYMLQPHNTPSFAGVAPQGAMSVDGDYLVVPGGRSVPACYDRRTGRFIHYEIAANNKKAGGSAAVAAHEMILNGGYAFSQEHGNLIDGFRFEGLPVFAPGRAYFAAGSEIQGVSFGTPMFTEREGKDRRGNPIKVRKLDITTAWSADLDARGDLIRAGDMLVGCAGSDVFVVDPTKSDKNAAPLWQTTIEGTAVRLLAADDRLFVVTREGNIYCFAGDAIETPRTFEIQPKPIAANADARSRARRLTSLADAQAGHAVVWGAGDGSLTHALLADTELNLVIVEPDLAKANALRTALVASGTYGARATVLSAVPDELQLPPYFAVAMFCENAADASLKLDAAGLERMFKSLRPFGGTACFGLDDGNHAKLTQTLASANLSRAELRRDGDVSLIVRVGPLAGSADYTHENADAANTRTSQDELVKAPLGILWYGGPSHAEILPRHGHGPQPQVVEGRVIQEGPNLLRATDAYTGRLLWERKLPGIGTLYDNTSHHPGANGTGGNFISQSDGIYAIYPPGCIRLDPDTGKTIGEFSLPAIAGSAEPPTWNYLNVVDDYLVAAIDLPESLIDPRNRAYEDVVASKRISVFNRRDGRLLWSQDAEFQFRNNAVCLGGGRLYCIDLLSNAELDLLKRRGRKPQHKSKLYAFDLATGREVWSTDEGVFGTWLSYSVEHDVLIESGRPGRDVLKDEVKGMRAFRAADGEQLWSEGHSGPAIIHGDRILTDRQACEMLTGKLIERTDPLTGKQVTWNWTRNYGCNTPQASKHLMLFRSGAAGYCDLTNDGGTGNFGGFRSSCSNNLIAAAGILSVPEYTRTCTCDYQVQTSVALVHMPDVELWTEFPLSDDEDVRHVALNLGAPGFRRAADGRLWINTFAGAEIEYDDPGFYCRHASSIATDGDLNWVAASGCRGIRKLSLDPGRKEAATYTVRLHFCDPDNAVAGRRVFDVKLQGSAVLESFDIAASAGGMNQPVVREFRGVQLPGNTPLRVEFVSHGSTNDDPTKLPVLNGIELILE